MTTATTTSSTPQDYLSHWQQSLSTDAGATVASTSATTVPSHVLDFFSMPAKSASMPPSSSAYAAHAPATATSGRGGAAPPPATPPTMLRAATSTTSDPTPLALDHVAQALKRTSITSTTSTSATSSGSTPGTSRTASAVVSPAGNVRAVASTTRKSAPPSDDEEEDEVDAGHGTDDDDDDEDSGDDKNAHKSKGKGKGAKHGASTAATTSTTSTTTPKVSKKQLKAEAKAAAAALEARKVQMRQWLDDPEFYWQVQKIDAVTKVGFSKHHVSWRFVVGTQRHELDLSHSPISGKRVIRLDGVEVVNGKSALEGEASHRIQIDDAVIEVHLVASGWGLTQFDYELYINRKAFEAAKKSWLIKVRNQLDAMGGGGAPTTTTATAPASAKK